MTAAEFRDQLSLPFYKPNENHNTGQGPNTKPQCHAPHALGRAVQGEDQSAPSIVVRFTGYRVRPLDPDNFAGGLKHLLDGLRHAGLIPEDTPTAIDFQTRQVRVRHFAEEETQIEIITPEVVNDPTKV